MNLPFRVYVLKCAGKHANDEYFWYVGIIEVKALIARMKKHFSKDVGASFTKAHRPLSIELVWPAAVSAAEALVSHLLSFVWRVGSAWAYAEYVRMRKRTYTTWGKIYVPFT